MDFSDSGLLMKHIMMKSGQRFAMPQTSPFARAGAVLGLLTCLVLTSCQFDNDAELHTIRPCLRSQALKTDDRSLLPEGLAQPPVNKPSSIDYRIQPLDTIDISVFNETDLSVQKRVSPQGFITYPMLGYVQVGGLTVGETEAKLKDLLGRNILVNPQVTVLVNHANSRHIVILGQVKSPGCCVDIGDERITLVQAIARAGGFTDVAASDRVSVIRSENGLEKKIIVNVAAIIKGSNASKDLELKPDDVISVPETIF